MKKFITTLLMAAFVFTSVVAVGCGDGTTTKKEEKKAEEKKADK